MPKIYGSYFNLESTVSQFSVLSLIMGDISSVSSPFRLAFSFAIALREVSVFFYLFFQRVVFI